jgi:hypothetical protein
MHTVVLASLETRRLRRKEDTPGKPAERRPKSRKQVLVGGIVAFEGGQRSFDCTIRDLSETGARVLAAKGAEFPPRFYLINIRDRVAYDARPVRRNGLEAGVVFQKTLPLSGLTDPALGFLKRMWLSKAAR